MKLLCVVIFQKTSPKVKEIRCAITCKCNHEEKIWKPPAQSHKDSSDRDAPLSAMPVMMTNSDNSLPLFYCHNSWLQFYWCCYNSLLQFY